MTAISTSPNKVRIQFAQSGGGWWTRVFSQRLGSYFAAVAIKAGVSPNQISFLSAVVGSATSAAVVGSYQASPYLAGALALTGWQIAYGLDCTDGQVARATHQTSNAGAQFDLLCDFVGRLAQLTALASIVFGSVRQTYVPAALAAISICWIIPLFHDALVCGGPPNAVGPPVKRPSWLRLAGSTSRDYGVHLFLLAVAIAVNSLAVLSVLGLVAALHVLFLLKRSLTLFRSPVTSTAESAR
jgi:phosphatidylglycerophosphate synthase